MPLNDSDSGNGKNDASNSANSARTLTSTATLRPTKKPNKLKSWGKIQQKTEALKSEVKKRKESKLFGSNLKKYSDRRHNITAQIDAIRAEQADRLHEKQKQKKINDDSIGNPKSFLLSFTIQPKATWKQIWDIALLILVIFSAIYIPLQLALPDMGGIPNVLQVIFDFTFLVDFGFCFRTGYIRADNEVEMDQAKIVTHYVGSWFAIDLLASFPLDYILILFNSEGQDTRIKNILRLLKLPRLVSVLPTIIYTSFYFFLLAIQYTYTQHPLTLFLHIF